MKSRDEKAQGFLRRIYWPGLVCLALIGMAFNGHLLAQIRNAESGQQTEGLNRRPWVNFTPKIPSRYSPTRPSASVELARATSPDGLLDAVVLTSAPARPEILDPGVFEAAVESGKPLLMTFVRIVPSGETVPNESPYYYGAAQYDARIIGRSCFLAKNASEVSVVWRDHRTLRVQGTWRMFCHKMILADSSLAKKSMKSAFSMRFTRRTDHPQQERPEAQHRCDPSWS